MRQLYGAEWKDRHKPPTQCHIPCSSQGPNRPPLSPAQTGFAQ